MDIMHRHLTQRHTDILPRHHLTQTYGYSEQTPSHISIRISRRPAQTPSHTDAEGKSVTKTCTYTLTALSNPEHRFDFLKRLWESAEISCDNPLKTPFSAWNAFFSIKCMKTGLFRKLLPVGLTPSTRRYMHTNLLDINYISTRGSQRDVVYLCWPIAPKCGGVGLRGLSQWVRLCTWSPNKIWRSNSIFNLWFQQYCSVYDRKDFNDWVKGTQAWIFFIYFFAETETIWSQGPVTRDFFKSYSNWQRYSTFKHFRACSACDEIGS
jgi:hypothetical protein